MAAILLDVDGVLHLSGVPVPGAAAAVGRLRAAGHRLRFVTNNTTRSRRMLVGDLRRMGFDLDEEEVQTTPLAAGRLLEGKRVLALTMAAIQEDLAHHVTLVDANAEVVLLGGCDETDENERVFNYGTLSRAFHELRAGARFVCLHRNRWWQTGRGPLLDAGAFVVGLQYATGIEAEVVGKPSRLFYEAALAAVGAAPEEATMVGDDVEADIGGAKALGLRAILVRTGKFREETLKAATLAPDAVIGTVAELPAFLESGSR